jgi:rhamnosyltransferase subunit B
VRIEQHGIQFRQAAPNQDFNDRTFQRRAMHEMTGGQYLLRDNFLPKIRESYENLLAAATDADLLVTQMLAYAGPLVAEKTSLPWVSTVLAPLSFFSYEDSPVLASRLNAVRESVPRLNALINRVARSTTQSWNEPVYRLRRELGLRRGAEPIYEGQHSPACVLALFSSVLAPAQSDWPRQTTITGFPFLEETASHAEVPPALDEFLAAGPAPVVFTLGTSAVLNPGPFYAESVKAVRSLGVRAVMLDGESGPGIPGGRDILRIAYAPHGYLFSKAAAVVHAGGIGTCARAMRAQLPMMIVPFAYDQPDNALRLVRLGVARTVARNSYTARRAAREIGALLSDARYSTNVHRVSQVIESEDGTSAACDALERYL